MTVERFALMAALSTALLGCDQRSESEPRPSRYQAARNEVAAEKTVEAGLMADRSAAAAELRDRLKKHVVKVGGLLVILNRRLPPSEIERAVPRLARASFSVASLPLTVAWTVHCSPSGVSVSFGSVASGEISAGAGSFGPGVSVALTDAAFTEERCIELVATLGQAILEIAAAQPR
jgi:hypothetical protein